MQLEATSASTGSASSYSVIQISRCWSLELIVREPESKVDFYYLNPSVVFRD